MPQGDGKGPLGKGKRDGKRQNYSNTDDRQKLNQSNIGAGSKKGGQKGPCKL